jgi:aerobic-type carbon monoxide dehydrogenase small subunit (CoxS/CutS family)
MDTSRRLIYLTVNGVPRSVLVSPEWRLLKVLRDGLGLTGTKVGCEVGVCGACTVLVNGLPTSSCLLWAFQASNSEVITVEGLTRFEDLRMLQRLFMEEGAFQCGYCTSGQLVSVAALVLSGALRTMSDSDIRLAMAGNLCRCTGYYGILRAIARMQAVL